MRQSYDCIIIGAGPAGCSAALTLRARNQSVLVCYSGLGALATAHQVDNYPGLPQASGSEMLRIFHEQCIAAGADMLNKAVRQILPMGDTVSVLAGENILTAKNVILCIGVVRKGRIPGEQDAVGKGLSYCATCDGMFYRGKKIAVISAYSEGVEECNFLASLAAETLYFSEKDHDRQHLDARVRVMDEKVTGIVLEKDRVSAVACGEQIHPVDGVFILRPSSPPDQMAPGLEMQNGAIKIDEKCRTNLHRIYAAGDCAGTPYQIAWAAGQGNKAALSVVQG